MALSSKYGRLDIPRIGEEEPVFILRAQDRLAEPAIAMYQLLVASHGCKLAGDVSREIASFREWKGVRKFPD